MKFTAPVLCFSSLALALGPRVDDAARLQATKAPETLPDSCTFRPTVTSTATTGCPTNCDTVALCVADAAVTLPCGCAKVTVEPSTLTVCPTTTACSNCETAWGFVTVTPTTCGAAPTSHP